jgi:hypothetical protein
MCEMELFGSWELGYETGKRASIFGVSRCLFPFPCCPPLFSILLLNLSYWNDNEYRLVMFMRSLHAPYSCKVRYTRKQY